MVALHKESESGGLECGNCESGDPPVNKCTTCLHFLCEFCTQAHRRGRGTSSHNLISLEEAKKMGCEAVKKPLFCKEHEGEMMKLFCETCEEAICRDCTIVKHRDHKYTFVKDAFSKCKESLMEILSETKTKSSELKEALDRVSDTRTSILSCAEQTVQKAINCFDELRALIDTRLLELIRDIKNLKEAKLTSLESQQQELETAQGCVQSGVDFTEKAFENGSEVEILNMHRQMISRLEELNEVELQLEPCVDNVFMLRDDKVSRELEHEIAKFCVVTDTVAHAGMGHGQEGLMYNTQGGQPIGFGSGRVPMTHMATPSGLMAPPTMMRQKMSALLEQMEQTLPLEGMPPQNMPQAMQQQNPAVYLEMNMQRGQQQFPQHQLFGQQQQLQWQGMSPVMQRKGNLPHGMHQPRRAKGRGTFNNY